MIFDCRLKRYAHHMPVWANKKEMRRLYNWAYQMRYHIDHIVPLNSPLVCGLHCENNLRVLHPNVNIKKSNKTWPGQWLEQLELFEIEADQLRLNI